MLASCRQNLMRFLASVSLAGNCGVADPGASLAQIPARLVTELVDDTLESSWRPDDRKAVLSLLAKDPRARVRCAIAQAASNLEDPLCGEAQELLRILAADHAWPVRETAAQALARSLQRANVSTRVRTVCEWALADSAAQRLAVARALARPIQLPAADVALTHLARDPEASVRRAALVAMGSQFWLDDPVVRETAQFALGDPDRRVRRAAAKLLARANRGERVVHHA
jgi:HEAT repeat protein